jgi:hypothetical protein
VRLRRRDPGRNMDRFYSLLLRQTLFGDHVVTREWGRIGRPVRCARNGSPMQPRPPQTLSGAWRQSMPEAINTNDGIEARRDLGGLAYSIEYSVFCSRHGAGG